MARARVELPADVRAKLKLALRAGPVACLWTVGHWVLNGIDWSYLVLPAVLIAPVLLWALTRPRRPALVIDDEGVQRADDVVAWSEVKLLWISTSPTLFRWSRRFAWVTMTGWSLASLEYARRTGFVITASIDRPVWTNRTPEQLAELIRSVAPPSVVVRTGPGREALLQKVRDGVPVVLERD